MNFAEQLREYIGRSVQVFLTVDTISGVLSAVGESTIVVRTSGVPGYSEPQNVNVVIGFIAYVRVID